VFEWCIFFSLNNRSLVKKQDWYIEKIGEWKCTDTDNK
jgi:hypothetical protein